MSKLSAHLDDSEVLCHCANPNCIGKNPAHFKLATAELFEEIRKRVSDFCGCDVPITINSGLRCPLHNKDVGGADNSRHLPDHGDAFDLVCPQQIEYNEFYRICAQTVDDHGGCGRYPIKKIVHGDTRGHYRRWVG